MVHSEKYRNDAIVLYKKFKQVCEEDTLVSEKAFDVYKAVCSSCTICNGLGEFYGLMGEFCDTCKSAREKYIETCAAYGVAWDNAYNAWDKARKECKKARKERKLGGRKNEFKS